MNDIIKTLEAIMFVAESPLTIQDFVVLTGRPEFEIEEALQQYGDRLMQSSALQLIRIAGGFQICTKPEFAEVVSKLTSPQSSKLSRSLLEVLAIVAYQQPVTTAEVDAVRGVDSSYAIRQLLDKRLICECGRKKTPGRPHLFGTTQQFLHVFNLEDLSKLPPIDHMLPSPESQMPELAQPHLSLES